MQSGIQEIIVFLELRIDRKPGRCSFLGMKACLTSSCGTHWKMRTQEEEGLRV